MTPDITNRVQNLVQGLPHNVKLKLSENEDTSNIVWGIEEFNQLSKEALDHLDLNGIQMQVALYHYLAQEKHELLDTLQTITVITPGYEKKLELTVNPTLGIPISGYSDLPELQEQERGAVQGPEITQETPAVAVSMPPPPEVSPPAKEADKEEVMPKPTITTPVIAEKPSTTPDIKGNQSLLAKIVEKFFPSKDTTHGK